MKINNFQAGQPMHHLLRPESNHEGKIDKTKKDFFESANSGFLPKGVSPEAKTSTIIAPIEYIQEQLDAILVDYPPFFPLGKFQRADLIKKIQGIQDQVEKSPLSSDIKRNIKNHKVSENANDNEIGIALKGFINLKNAVSQNPSAVDGNLETLGVTFDIKI